jgi:hypothetical protein
MLRDQEQEAPRVPCALCPADAAGDVWDVQLCHRHIGQWQRDCPGVLALARPKDVAERRPSAFGGPEFVLPKPGAEARLLAAWTQEWAKRARLDAQLGRQATNGPQDGPRQPGTR